MKIDEILVTNESNEKEDMKVNSDSDQVADDDRLEDEEDWLKLGKYLLFGMNWIQSMFSSFWRKW